MRFTEVGLISILLFFFQFWYFTYGTKDVLERECKDLHTKLKVRCAPSGHTESCFCYTKYNFISSNNILLK